MLERVRQRLRDLAPDIEKCLLPSARDAQLEMLRAQFKTKLPGDLMDLYRDSAGLDPDATANFAFGLGFTDIDSVVRQLQNADSDFDDVPLKFADPGIRKNFTHGKLRIEIGNDSAHCKLCVDLAPDIDGNYGQVIFVDEVYQVSLMLARSIRQFIAKFENDLAAGKYSLHEDALEDGVQWLSPSRDINLVNWFKSPTWQYAKTS